MIRLLILGLIFLVECQTEVNNDLTNPPEKINDGLEVASSMIYDANISLLDSMIQGVERGDFVNIHSILIVKENKLILEKYFDNNNRNTRHEIRSATKSIGSILTGIAIDKGFIPSEDSFVYEFLKDEYSPSYGWDSKASHIKISHLLTMLSGYDCDDLNTNFACENAMYETDDWVQYSLDLPISYEPGLHWAYNSSSLILVSEIIARTSGMDLDEFAEKYLFGPLGIRNFQWVRSPKDREWIGGGARMISREMVKIGLLMQNQGMWGEDSIISQEWIAKSTRKHSEMLGSGVDYCFLWQTGATLVNDQLVKAFWASGNGGQYIIIIPALDMVIVFTGGNYNSQLANQPFDLLCSYILPAFTNPGTYEAIEIDEEFLHSLLGVYSLDFEPSVTSTIDIYQNKIRILTPDNQYVQLEPVTKTIFKGESALYGSLSVQFIENDIGKITKLITYGGFSRYTFEKKNNVGL